LKLSKGEVYDLSFRRDAKILRGGAKRSQGRSARCTSPHLPSKSGLDANKSPQLKRTY
jgi:hypothetical protein